MAEAGEKSTISTKFSLFLAIITVIIAIINGLPAFIALRGKEAYIVYQSEARKMLYPPDSDPGAIHSLLIEKNLPDSFGTIVISNRGDVSAKVVVITVSVPGVIVAEKTDPAPEAKPAWVTITRDFDPVKDKSRIKYTLTDVGLNRDFKIYVSYISDFQGDISWDVFYDGNPGEEVINLASVPENARSISFRPALIILVVGMALSLMIFALSRVPVTRFLVWFLTGGIELRNGRFRIYRGETSSTTRWLNYRNAIIAELASSNKMELVSTSVSGNFQEKHPTDFWDALVFLNGLKIALDASVTETSFFTNHESRLEYCVRLVTMATRTDELFAVAVINEENEWEANDGEIEKLILQLNSSGVSFYFFGGDPQSVASALLDRLAKAVPVSVVTETVQSTLSEHECADEQ